MVLLIRRLSRAQIQIIRLLFALLVHLISNDLNCLIVYEIRCIFRFEALNSTYPVHKFGQHVSQSPPNVVQLGFKLYPATTRDEMPR